MFRSSICAGTNEVAEFLTDTGQFREINLCNISGKRATNIQGDELEQPVLCQDGDDYFMARLGVLVQQR